MVANAAPFGAEALEPLKRVQCSTHCSASAGARPLKIEAGRLDI
jgi:hypothetical protein